MKKPRGPVALFVLALLALASFACVSTRALGLTTENNAASGGACNVTDKDCCQAPCCRLYSLPTTEEVKEEKSCRKVKCEKVAVPAITLPWEQGGSPLTLFNCLKHFGSGHASQSHCASCAECCDTCGLDGTCCECGPRRCGTVRCVHVLDEEKYDVTKCETTWEVKCAPCCTQTPCCE